MDSKTENSMLQNQVALAMNSRKERNVYAESCIEEYFRLKKNLTIAAILDANIDIQMIENPATIFVLQNESVYNVYTKRLIIAGGSPTGFIELILREHKPYIDRMSVDTDKLYQILDYCYSNDVLVEFIDLTKMTIDEYMTKWLKNDKNSQC